MKIKIKARITLWLVLNLICIGGVFAQKNVNPFEIATRMDSLNNKAKTTGRDTKGNVFDIANRNHDQGELIPSEMGQENTSDIVPPVIEEDAQVSNQHESKGNPFDVSHIPIRKIKKQNHGIREKEGQGNGKNPYLFWLVILSLMLISMVVSNHKETMKNIFSSLYKENVFKINFKKSKGGTIPSMVLMYIVFGINFSIFIYLLAKNFLTIDVSKWFWWSFAIVFGIYITKHLILAIIGYVFPVKKEIKLYGFSIENFNIALGVLLIPINLIVAYSPPEIGRFMLYTGILIIMLLMIFRIFRVLIISSNLIQKSFFHYLLYLCAIEILPIVLFIKIWAKMNF